MININLKYYLEQIRKENQKLKFISILDEKGQWFLAQDDNQEWSNNIPSREHYNVIKTSPLLWENFISSQKSVIFNQQKTYLFQWYDFPELLNLNGVNPAIMKTNKLLYVLTFDPEFFKKLNNDLTQFHIYLFLLLAPLLLLSIWLYVYSKSSQLKAEQAIIKHNEQLEHLVSERTIELQQAVESANQANQSKSAFLANMSHELRTPMHAVLSFTNIVKKKLTDPKLIDKLDKAIDSGNRLTNLINDLLDLSKLEAGKMDLDISTHDLHKAAEVSIDELSSLAHDKNINIEVSSKGQPNAEFDYNKLLQVYKNLLSNALKFSPENNRIELKIKPVKTNHISFLQVSVIDSGIGIPSDELETVFDKFVQSSKTKTQAGGTGLGLAICKEIIEAHGGEIWVLSPPHKREMGTEFIFTIPINQMPNETSL